MKNVFTWWGRGAGDGDYLFFFFQFPFSISIFYFIGVEWKCQGNLWDGFQIIWKKHFNICNFITFKCGKIYWRKLLYSSSTCTLAASSFHLFFFTHFICYWLTGRCSSSGPVWYWTLGCWFLPVFCSGSQTSFSSVYCKRCGNVKPG